jgi:hypothetical protein
VCVCVCLCVCVCVCVCVWGQTDIAALENEIAMMSMSKHESIVEYMESFMWDKQVPCSLLSPAYPLWRHVTSRCPTPQQGSNCSAALAALAALAAQRAQHLQRNERKCCRAAIAAQRAQHLQRDERSTCSATSAALAGQRNKRSTCRAAQQAQHLRRSATSAALSCAAFGRPPVPHGAANVSRRPAPSGLYRHGLYAEGL